MADDDFELLILGFERAWQHNDSPRIAVFLEQACTLGLQERRRLLVELICIDLEFRWRNGSLSPHSQKRLMLEDYASEFPDLAALDQLPLELIAELKPANLVLDNDGSIRVTDFGLARSLTEHTPWTAEVEGTAPFMAPEQASRYWGRIDTRTDIYGIGAVLYTLLTGRPPWIGRRLADILADVVSGAPVASLASLRPDLPNPVNDICRRCLSKAQADRYQTVQEVRSALAGL